MLAAKETDGGRSVAVVGAGGNIGSHLVPLLGRLAAVTRLTLIDPDVYTAANLPGQDATSADVGRPKVFVQARRLRRIRPELEVRTLRARVEDVPLGCLRADVILAGLDSRAPRRCVNQAAARLGRPWIDAGVQTDARLVRVEVLQSGPDAPCLECAWDDTDYAVLEQTYACPGGAAAAPTDGIAALGSLAASLQALVAEQLLSNGPQRAALGRQIVLDARHHKHYVTTLVRNPRCRCDHTAWSIECAAAGPAQLTLADALRSVPGPPAAALRVESRPFVREMACPRCGDRRTTLRLHGRLRARERCCPACAVPMSPVGFEMRDRLEIADLPPYLLARPLRAFGFLEGDVFTLEWASGDAHHFELAQSA